MRATSKKVVVHTTTGGGGGEGIFDFLVLTTQYYIYFLLRPLPNKAFSSGVSFELMPAEMRKVKFLFWGGLQISLSRLANNKNKSRRGENPKREKKRKKGRKEKRERGRKKEEKRKNNKVIFKKYVCTHVPIFPFLL